MQSKLHTTFIWLNPLFHKDKRPLNSYNTLVCMLTGDVYL